MIEKLNIRSLEDLLVSEEEAEEKDEGIAIKNMGLLMFGERSGKLIAGSKIELLQRGCDGRDSDLFESGSDYQFSRTGSLY